MTKGQTFHDRWSVPHVASGFLLGWVGMGLPATLATLFAFELYECQLRAIYPEGEKLLEPESNLNVLGDLFFGVAGWMAHNYIKNGKVN